MATAQELIASLSSEKETIEIPFGSYVVTCRLLKSAEEMIKLEKESTRFYDQLKKRPLPEYQPYLPISPEVARMAHWIRTLAIDPAFSIVDILQFQKECGFAMSYLFNELVRASGGSVAENEKAALDDEGEG